MSSVFSAPNNGLEPFGETPAAQPERESYFQKSQSILSLRSHSISSSMSRNRAGALGATPAQHDQHVRRMRDLIAI
jgi:hypothetical protein